jgi:hypothetical protein
MWDKPHTSSIRCLPIGLALLMLAGSIVAGCGDSASSESAIAAANQLNIQRLANLYFAFQLKNELRGPPNEQAFKEFLRGYDASKLNRIGVDPNGIDDLFINERDGRPFEIRYGVRGSMMGSSEPVIFESEGVGGRRMIGFLNMEQREVDEEEYDDLWAGRIPAAANPRSAERDR